MKYLYEDYPAVRFSVEGVGFRYSRQAGGGRLFHHHSYNSSFAHLNG